ncbi:hypothetical protein SAMN04487970_10024 [Paenibacillus tianmuensis]|uniref:Lipoprotein n=1 Tax=Paenibacillus tianmuensis TaxID=624147 RepID=A0A1G4PCP2_9BACL|nr:hypothetical protein [Paenibacillus tianmuensis]SCW29925.1 hypothetical protein SAMN04487970_10024 [Paenibacillus tianmuensis]
MKNSAKWMLVVFILSIITACEGKIDPQPPQGNEAGTKTVITNTTGLKTDAKEKDSKANQSISPDNVSSTNNKMLACQKELEERGQFSEYEGNVDYKSGPRIFPLLHFIMTKKSIEANEPEQTVYMKDNPIFVTSNKKYGNSLLFTIIHSKRTGVLHGVTDFPDNKVTKFYKSMVGDIKRGNIQIPFTEVSPRNRAVEVNRKTWENELAKYMEPCKDSLILPPTKTAPPFFNYSDYVYPFSKEIDFVAGAEGVGAGLEQSIKRYVDEKKIRIPILFYCPGCKVENVVMVQNNVELKFTEAEKNSDWQKWLGSDWHMYISEKVDFDEKVFADAFFYGMRTHLPPFISEYPSTVQATINGEQVKYVNR